MGVGMGDAVPLVARLPESTSGEVTSTPLPAFFDSTTTIALDTSAAVIPAGQALALEAPTPEQDAWLLRLQPSAAPGASAYTDLLAGKSTSIATFQVKDHLLGITWMKMAPPAIQRQLRNCVLTLAAGGQHQAIIFRYAEVSTALTLSLSYAPQKLELEILDPPLKERLRFELLQVDGFDADVTRIPATGIVPANERLRLLPQLTLASEFQLELSPSQESLAVHVRPYITLVEGSAPRV